MSWSPDVYQSCYCEENIYMLLKRKLSEYSSRNVEGTAASEEAPAELYAVFISSPSKATPIWCQRCMAHSPTDPVLWDYHVIAMEKPRRQRVKNSDIDPNAATTSSSLDNTDAQEALKTIGSVVIWDYDTTLPFPCGAAEYVSKAIRPEVPLRKEFSQYFRVVPATALLAHFASDRRHMKDDKTGEFIKPPPIWDEIRGSASESPHNLDQYMSADESLRTEQFGVIMKRNEFCEFVINESIVS